MVYNSILTKVNIIEKDPTEKDIRKYLNYGHTLGHAIESVTQWNHGYCVALGMIL